MKITLYILVITLVTCLLSCNDDLDIAPNYPTVIKELDTLAQQTLTVQISEAGLYDCTYIDNFGFPFIYQLDSCIDFENWKLEMTTQELEQNMKNAVIEYGFFLNTRDSSLVDLKQITTSEGMDYDQFNSNYPDSIPPVWIISTHNQDYDGLEIRGTSLQFVFSPVGLISIIGQWYSDVLIPSTDNFTETLAKESILNTEFSYSSSELIANDETYWYTSKKLIIPVRESDEIELHVCWALYPETWEILVDTQTGDVISAIDISLVK